jgi:hypothetical protein
MLQAGGGKGQAAHEYGHEVSRGHKWTMFQQPLGNLGEVSSGVFSQAHHGQPEWLCQELQKLCRLQPHRSLSKV